MPSLKLLIFCAVLTVCYCDPIKKHKHKYELYWHGFHYLTFLVLKFKTILVLGSIFAVGLIIGKIFAIIKVAEYMKKNPSDDHPGKVVYISPHGDHPSEHPLHHGFPEPGQIYGKSHGSHEPYNSFPPGFTVDQPPPGAQTLDGGNFNNPEQMFGSGMYPAGPPNQGFEQTHMYGRSIESYNIYEYFKLFTDAIKRLNITDAVFNDMNIKTNICRRKFVCKVDYESKDSMILRSAFNMFSDDNYKKYKTKEDIKSLDMCDHLYRNCIAGT